MPPERRKVMVSEHHNLAYDIGPVALLRGTAAMEWEPFGFRLKSRALAALPERFALLTDPVGCTGLRTGQPPRYNDCGVGGDVTCACWPLLLP